MLAYAQSMLKHLTNMSLGPKATFNSRLASERSQESRISIISTGLKGLKGFLRLAPTER